MKKLEKLLIIGVLLISVVSLGAMALAKTEYQDANIVIVVENEVEQRIPLEVQEQSQTYEFKFRDKTGFIEVKNGRVRMQEMDKEICPKGICSDTGWIDSTNQAIVCLPNKIIVTIQGMDDYSREEIL
ncbi:NusG domain II-containing protein [Desulfitobacterium sp. THU1]|uniref:NusG domain II-containing protein n=1 Tax=Desulfitobacterium sp. THU1 TaxID=3138072 RepID=UPI00311DFAD7